MAILISRATGNFTNAATWQVVNNTSYSNSESSTVAVTTSYQNSSTFTPGAVNMTGVAIKLSVRTGTTGTITVALDQGGSTVTNTEISINTADLPVAASADLNGGWIFFKFTNTVSLAGATAYSLKVKTSSSSQVSLFATGGTNWSRALATDVTQAPVAGDDFIICKEHTGAGTGNNFTVTMNETATTDYGSAATSLVTPAISICNGGSLVYGTSASTNYMLKVSGNIVIYSGGTYQQGGPGAEMPRNSTADLQIDCGANVDFGIVPRNFSNFITSGLSRTSGKNIDRCLLNTDEAIASTSLGVDTDTGWLDNDVIAVASTTRTYTQSENGTLNGNAGASTLTVDGFGGAGGGLAFAHSGTAPTQARVILLTRNVRIYGASSTLQTYIDIKATANVNCDWTEFYWMGSATTNKRGIDTACTTGTQTFDYCSFHDFIVSSSRGINMSGTTGTGLSINNCVSYNIANEHFTNVTTTGSSVFNNIIAMKNAVSTSLFSLSDVGGTVTNIVAISSIATGITITDSTVWGTISGLEVHSCNADGISTANGVEQYIDGLKSWRNTSNGYNPSITLAQSITIKDFDAFGNGNYNFRATGGTFTLISPIFSGDSTFSTSQGYGNQGNGGAVELKIINGSFGVVSGIRTAHTASDIGFTGQYLTRITLINTILASSTDVATPSSLGITSFISSQKHNQTVGLHKTWKRYGTITIDTTNYYSAPSSVKMTPNNASYKLESSGSFGGFKVPVANGQSVTPTIYVSEDSAYTAGSGNFMRLIVKRNDALGISADTVLDTATVASQYSGGHQWEALTGTTATVTDDGTLEFVVDCDGTTGSVYLDKFTVV